MANSGNRSIIITIDTSDLKRVANNMRVAASETKNITRDALLAEAATRSRALKSVTPRSADVNNSMYPSRAARATKGHLQDSYYVEAMATSAVVGTTDASKWKIVNTEQGDNYVMPIHEKAMSWPGMTGPRVPLWDPTPGYGVSPIYRLEWQRGFTRRGHPSLDLDNKARKIYEPVDQPIMQATSDAMLVAVIYGSRRSAQAATQPRDALGRFTKAG